MLCFFFFNDTATTEIYTLSLHDALPIFAIVRSADEAAAVYAGRLEKLCGELGVPSRSAELSGDTAAAVDVDRKSTRLNSSHANISYAVFCLKKKKLP